MARVRIVIRPYDPVGKSYASIVDDEKTAFLVLSDIVGKRQTNGGKLKSDYSF